MGGLGVLQKGPEKENPQNRLAQKTLQPAAEPRRGGTNRGWERSRVLTRPKEQKTQRSGKTLQHRGENACYYTRGSLEKGTSGGAGTGFFYCGGKRLGDQKGKTALQSLLFKTWPVNGEKKKRGKKKPCQKVLHLKIKPHTGYTSRGGGYSPKGGKKRLGGVGKTGGDQEISQKTKKLGCLHDQKI